MRTILQMILIVIGGLLLANSLFISTRTNFSLAIVLPALIGLPLLLWGLFYRPLLFLSQRGFWHGVKIVLIVGYSMLAVILLSAGSLMLHQLRQKPAENIQAIVVPGAGLRGEAVSALLAARLNSAFELWQKNPEVMLVVCGGQGPNELIPEAEAMARYLLRRGVPEEKIIREDQSTSTRENLELARFLLLQHFDLPADAPGPPVCVVTSNYHVYRAVRQANQIGFQTSGLGAPTLWYLLPGDFLRETLAIGRWLILRY